MIKDHSGEFMRNLAAAIDAGLRAAVTLAEDSVDASMPGAGAGFTLTRGGKKKWIPSNPGQPPGVRRGGAIGLKSTTSSGKVRPGVWRYGANAPHARALELGTSRMAPRPFLRPVLVRERVAMERAFTRTAARRMARAVTSGGS